jgi:lipid II:glycine glycyltransferase (peptidoglycan interpeptide bridge formation enzyme)
MEFIENVGKKEYSKFVQNHKYSHFLKSYEWAEVSKLKGWLPFCVSDQLCVTM